MSNEIYLGEVDVRRIEELTSRLEDLNQNINTLTETFKRMKENHLVCFISPMVKFTKEDEEGLNVAIDNIAYTLNEVRNDYNVNGSWEILEAFLKQVMGKE
jgi:superfamily I DNA and RNA helicase